MGMINSVLLIDSLFSGCNDDEKNKLVELYRNAYISTDEYKELKRLLNECEYSGSIGKNLFDEGSRVINEGFHETGKFNHNLTKMQFVISNTKKELENTDSYLNALRYDNNDLYVIKKETTSSVKMFYTELINYLCYTFTTFFGASVLKDIKIDINQNCLDTIKMFGNEFANAINETKNKSNPVIWCVKRNSFKGINFVHYDGFIVLRSNKNLEKIKSDCIEIKPYLYMPKEKSDIVCYGVGNITNMELKNSISILNSVITETLPLNIFDDDSFDYENFDVSAVLKRIKETCVMKPEKFVDVINRYFMMKTVKLRNQNQKCPYCGNNNCNHFAIPENFSTALTTK